MTGIGEWRRMVVAVLSLSLAAGCLSAYTTKAEATVTLVIPLTVSLTVLDSHDAGVAGATVRWADGSWHDVPGSTGADGKLLFTISNTSYNRIVVTYHQTSTELSHDQIDTAHCCPVVHTVDARLLFRDCQGHPLAGGALEQGQGSWVGIGTTNDQGRAPWEVFAGGPYQYRLTYSHVSQTKMMPVDGTTDNIFQTGSIDLGTQTATSPTGGTWWNLGPGVMQLLPGDYELHFSNGVVVTVTITAGVCQAGRLLTLLDGDGRGLAGGKATPAVGGSWSPTVPGATDASGHLFAVLPSGFTKVSMAVNQSSQEQQRAQLDGDHCTWQTSTATIKVKHWDGSGFGGVVIDQGGGFWDPNKAVTDGSGTAKVPIFAGASPKFRANWNNTSQEITQALTTPYVFQTGQVHSDSGKCSQWAGGSWYGFTQDMELLPGSFRFAFTDGMATTAYNIAAGSPNHIH